MPSRGFCLPVCPAFCPPQIRSSVNFQGESRKEIQGGNPKRQESYAFFGFLGILLLASQVPPHPTHPLRPHPPHKTHHTDSALLKQAAEAGSVSAVYSPRACGGHIQGVLTSKRSEPRWASQTHFHLPPTGFHDPPLSNEPP